MLYVKTKAVVSLAVHQTNQVILVSEDFHFLIAIQMITLSALPGKKWCLAFTAWGRDYEL